MIGRNAFPRASEFVSPVCSAMAVKSAGRRVLRAAAAAALILVSGLAGAAVPAAAPGPAKWPSSLSLAAALGAAFAVRRTREAVRRIEGGEPPPASDFLARHRRDGRVTAIEGEAGEGLVGYGLVDRLHEDDRKPFLAQLSAVATDARARAMLVRLKRDEGDYRRLEATTARAAGAGALVSAFRFNAPLAALAVELETAREEARLERSLKDRLLANMSHELRTPLNAILGFSEILGDSTLAPVEAEKRLEYARIIHSSADHLLSVVNLVLDMSRIEAG